MASETVVGVRMQGRAADERINRIVDRVLRRRRDRNTAAPDDADRAMTDRYATVPAQARDFQGQRAGIVTRVAAGAVDFLVVIVAIAVIYGGIAGVTFIIRPSSFHWPRNIGWSVPVLYFVLMTAYLALSWAGTGRTYGAALLGVRVVNHEGARMRVTGCDPARRSLRACSPLACCGWLSARPTVRYRTSSSGRRLSTTGALERSWSHWVKRLGRCRGSRPAVSSPDA